MSTIEELKNRASEVRDAVTKGSNTASKVGGLLYDMNDYMENMPVGCDASFSDVSDQPVQNKVINSRFINNENQLNSLNERAGSVESSVADLENILSSDYYDKEQVDNIVSRTPETDVIVISSLPSSGASNTLYRVPGPDNTTFSEYAWNGTSWIKLCEKDYGIDDYPLANSTNMVKSGGIHAFSPVYRCSLDIESLNGTVELKEWVGGFPSGTHYTIRLSAGTFTGSDIALILKDGNLNTIAAIYAEHFNDFVLDGVLSSSVDSLKLVVSSGSNTTTDISGDVYAHVGDEASTSPYLNSYIESYANGLHELFLENADASAQYYLRIVRTASYYYIQITNSAIYSDGSLVCEAYYKRDGSSKALANFTSKNNSGISGKVVFDINKVQGVGENTFSTALHLVNNKTSFDLSLSPTISNSYSGVSKIITVNKSGGKSYTSLLEGILDATQEFDSIIYVEEGLYDLKEEFEDYYGRLYFEEYSSTSPVGIILKNRIKIVFARTAKVVFNYTGSNEDVLSRFSPFNSGPYGFTLENLTLEASNCFYAIRDMMGNREEQYDNHYINCSIYLDNSENNYYYHPHAQKHGYHECIGGSLGKNGYIEIRNCLFETEWPKGGNVPSVGLDIVTYFNSSLNDAKNFLVVSGNYFSGKTSFRLSWFGPSTEITRAFVHDNSFGKYPVHRAENSQALVANTDLKAWNNEIRTETP